MKLVFSAHELPAARRYDAWREALCDHYVNVDTSAEETDDYDGFIREERFGQVTVTDCQLSPQTIVRRRSHLAHIDKDCYYLALTLKGCQRLEQHGRHIEYGVGSATMFSAAEPYKLSNQHDYRALYLEFPRAAFAQRGEELNNVLTASVQPSSATFAASPTSVNLPPSFLNSWFFVPLRPSSDGRFLPAHSPRLHAALP